MDLLTLQMAKNYTDETAATINDTNVSEDETWSSKKISGKFGSNNIWDDVEEAGIINTSTGEDEESTNGRRMPHDKGIAVTPGGTYYIKKTTTAKIRYTFYAADGTYIGNTDALGNSLVDSDVMSQKMVPPAGAAQFRAFASSSMVNAGLTVPAGVSADIDEINSDISTINRDLANKMGNPNFGTIFETMHTGALSLSDHITWTAQGDGWISMPDVYCGNINLSDISTVPFFRVAINDRVIWGTQAFVASRTRCSTPIIPVKRGDNIDIYTANAPLDSCFVMFFG